MATEETRPKEELPEGPRPTAERPAEERPKAERPPLNAEIMPHHAEEGNGAPGASTPTWKEPGGRRRLPRAAAGLAAIAAEIAAKAAEEDEASAPPGTEVATQTSEAELSNAATQTSDAERNEAATQTSAGRREAATQTSAGRREAATQTITAERQGAAPGLPDRESKRQTAPDAAADTAYQAAVKAANRRVKKIEAMRPRKPRYMSPAEAEDRCWNCRAIGHAAARCPRERVRYCPGCGQPGLDRAKCPRCRPGGYWDPEPSKGHPPKRDQDGAGKRG